MRIADNTGIDFECTDLESKYGGYLWRVTDRRPGAGQTALFLIVNGHTGRVFHRLTRHTHLVDAENNDVFLEKFIHCFAARFKFKKDMVSDFKRTTDAWAEGIQRDYYVSQRLAENLGKELDECG